MAIVKMDILECRKNLRKRMIKMTGMIGFVVVVVLVFAVALIMKKYTG
jgi:hypothetical protein